MQFRCIIVWLTLVLGSLPIAQMTLASSKPRDSAGVIVAEDKTSETHCKVWIDSPANEHACDPGSVIVARRTTYREVEQSRAADYAVLMGDRQKDTQIERELVAKVAAQARRQRAQPMACTEGWPWVGGSYLSIPGNPNSTKITYELKYRRRADCVVDFINDRAHTNGPTLGWQVSCVNKSQDCSQRGVVMDANWQPRNNAFFNMAFNSFVGREYWHISAAPCWNCGNPYGIYVFK